MARKRSEILRFEMTRAEALERGLLICECGHPENNHFPHNNACTHCKCQKYEEKARGGMTLIKDPEPLPSHRELTAEERDQIIDCVITQMTNQEGLREERADHLIKVVRSVSREFGGHWADPMLLKSNNARQGAHFLRLWQADAELLRAQREFLLAHGWKPPGKGSKNWEPPEAYSRPNPPYDFSHAVNSQAKRWYEKGGRKRMKELVMAFTYGMNAERFQQMFSEQLPEGEDADG